MNKQFALKGLKDFTSCLNDKYFLCYGTCLGALREADFIGHDLDIDIGIMRDDFKLEFINALLLDGFKLIRLYGMLECGLELSFKRDGIKIDLMIFYQSGNIIWNSLWDNGGKYGLVDMITHSYKKDVFRFSKKSLGGEYFYCLGEDYIESVYGVNWRTPVTPWNWRTDHLCHDDELKLKLKKIYG